MSAANIAFSVGTLLLFLAQRFTAFAGFEAVLTALALLVAYGGGAGLRVLALRRAQDDGVALAHRVGLVALALTLVAFGFYALTTDAVVGRLSWSDEAESSWRAVWSCAWPTVWILGALPLFALDWGVESSPVRMPRGRVWALLEQGLLVALGLALVFPVNYLANHTNERWDTAYFKTPTPGTATRAVVAALEVPVDVRIFMPPASEVAQELRHYFEDLESPNVRVSILDQAASPRLAKALQIRDNGYVAFTAGGVDLDPSDDPALAEESAPVTRTLRVETDLEEAKRVLRKLDEEVQRRLIEVGHGDRIAYVTQGHGELDLQGKAEVLDGQMTLLKDQLRRLGFKVRPLGAAQDLAKEVPADADVVAVLGPKTRFSQGEVDSLRRYLLSGGSLLIAQEPRLIRDEGRAGSDGPLAAMMAETFGLRLGEGVLAAESGIHLEFRNLLDRYNIVTNSFTHHPSSPTLASLPSEFMLVPASGYLAVVPGAGVDPVFTAKSLGVTWNDLDLDAQHDAEEGETLGSRNLVAALEGGEGDARWRAIVTADASMLSDFGFRARGNAIWLHDAVNWLIGAEALSGATQSEEDVRIEHTKEGQATWFYLTVLGVPLLVMVLGALRMRMRRRGPAGGKA